MRNATPVDDRPWLPPALCDTDGLCGVGGDLDADTLLQAYEDGVFPWFNDGDPILWWSPDPRAIIELDGLHISRRLARTIRQGKFRITFNQCFEHVMRNCGEDRDDGTWITDDMIAAYTELHRRGHAFSVEAWHGEILAGGTYGVVRGGLFAAESMFHRVTDASKVALAALVQRLNERGFQLLDVQTTTDHTIRMGAVEVPRKVYLRRLRAAVAKRDVRFV